MGLVIMIECGRWVRSGVAALGIMGSLALSVEPAAARCTVMKIAEVPLVNLGRSVAVGVTIANIKTLMILDTGASSATISPGFADRMRVPEGANKAPVLGTGGVVKADSVDNNVIEMGTIQLSTRSMRVVKMPFNQRELAGLLGGEVFAAYDLEIDIPGGRFALYDPNHCTDGFLPWSTDASPIPFTEQAGHLILVRPVINGKAVSAILDTGAQVTTLKISTARSIGLDVEKIFKEQTAEHFGVGVGGELIPTALARVKELRLGPIVHTNVDVSIGGLSEKVGSGFDMLLGFDFLQTNKLWISHRLGQVFLAPSAPRPSSAQGATAPVSSSQPTAPATGIRVVPLQ